MFQAIAPVVRFAAPVLREGVKVGVSSLATAAVVYGGIALVAGGGYALYQGATKVSRGARHAYGWARRGGDSDKIQTRLDQLTPRTAAPAFEPAPV